MKSKKQENKQRKFHVFPQTLLKLKKDILIYEYKWSENKIITHDSFNSFYNIIVDPDEPIYNLFDKVEEELNKELEKKGKGFYSVIKKILTDKEEDKHLIEQYFNEQGEAPLYLWWLRTNSWITCRSRNDKEEWANSYYPILLDSLGIINGEWENSGNDESKIDKYHNPYNNTTIIKFSDTRRRFQNNQAFKLAYYKKIEIQESKFMNINAITWSTNNGFGMRFQNEPVEYILWVDEKTVIYFLFAPDSEVEKIANSKEWIKSRTPYEIKKKMNRMINQTFMSYSLFAHTQMSKEEKDKVKSIIKKYNGSLFK